MGMNTKMKPIDTMYIAECFFCNIEYDDYTGLTEWEIEQLEAWLKGYPNCYFEYGDSSEFERCNITGLMGNCIEVHIYKLA